MMQYPSNTQGKGLKVGIVTARFNEKITSQMRKDARETLINCGVSAEDICEASVAGAFELPLVAKKFALTRHFDAIIVIGTVIKGETAHFEYVAKGVTEGTMQASLETCTPIIYGVLTTYTDEQAIERAFPQKIGKDFALTALEQGNLMKEILAGAPGSPGSVNMLHRISL